jgi:hypothetical protein
MPAILNIPRAKLLTAAVAAVAVAVAVVLLNNI